MSNVDRNGNAFGVANVTLAVGSIAANTSEEETYTVTGLTTDMFVAVNKPSLDAGIVVGNARVSADDTLAIQFINSTASAVDPTGSEVYKLFWWKPNDTSSEAVQL